VLNLEIQITAEAANQIRFVTLSTRLLCAVGQLTSAMHLHNLPIHRHNGHALTVSYCLISNLEQVGCVFRPTQPPTFSETWYL